MSARLRDDAPHIRGLRLGEWYDVLRAEDGDTAGQIRLRPLDAVPGDAASYIPVSRNMVELADTTGRRLFTDSRGRRWTAALELAAADDPRAARICFTGEMGATHVAPGVALPSLDPVSDSDLRDLLEACAAPLGGAAHTDRPARQPGLRVEARLKPGFAWAYRMLSPESWYEVDQTRTSEYGIMIRTPDGDRIIGAGHMELRSLLD